MQTFEERIFVSDIDIAIDAVLKCAGTSLKNYSMALHIDGMRCAMRGAINNANKSAVDFICKEADALEDAGFSADADRFREFVLTFYPCT